MSESEQTGNTSSTGGEGQGASHNEEVALGGGQERVSTPNEEASTTEVSNSSIPTAGVPLPVSVSSSHAVLLLERTADISWLDGMDGWMIQDTTQDAETSANNTAKSSVPAVSAAPNSSEFAHAALKK